MADDLSFSDFTRGEQLHLVALHARMAKRGLAGPAVDLTDLQNKVRRIEKRAERRKNKK